jgi:hypothetical protein
MGRKKSDEPRLRKRWGGNYTCRFWHNGSEVELSTGSPDVDVARTNAWAIFERVTGGVRYRKPRGLHLPRLRTMGVIPIVLAPPTPGIYFAWCTDIADRVKIGWSSNVRRRIRHLQTGLPGTLYLLHLEPGSKADELAIHHRFAAYRVRGEWFKSEAFEEWNREKSLTRERADAAM